MALYGWSDLVFTHISARIPGPEHHFLINPYGLMFDEITASTLVKIDQNCNKLSDSPFPVNPAGFIIHSCIHAVRDDAGCVLHTHTRAGVAVSAQKCGVLPLSQQATFVLASLAYHDYEGVALNDDEKPRLQADLGTANFLMLRNHGLLTVGRTIPTRSCHVHLREHLPHPDRRAVRRRAGARQPGDPGGHGPGHEDGDRRPGRAHRLAGADAQARSPGPGLSDLSRTQLRGRRTALGDVLHSLRGQSF